MNNNKSLLQRTIELIIFFAIVTISLIILDKFTSIFSNDKKNQSVLENPFSNENNASSTNQNNEIKATSSPLSDFEKYNSYNKISIYQDGIETPSDYIQNDTKS
jgi:hypothetical protein